MNRQLIVSTSSRISSHYSYRFAFIVLSLEGIPGILQVIVVSIIRLQHPHSTFPLIQ